MTPLDVLDRALVNRLQDGIDVCERPFLPVAAALGLAEEDLLDRLTRLVAQGVLSRFGPLFDTERLGRRADPGRPAGANGGFRPHRRDRQCLARSRTQLCPRPRLQHVVRDRDRTTGAGGNRHCRDRTRHRPDGACSAAPCHLSPGLEVQGMTFPHSTILPTADRHQRLVPLKSPLALHAHHVKRV
ncbi:MAG: putative AsnC family transcriptional regulator [Rhodospirillaceae bacterium]|nr:MAG: putative AsnC family transcriptional regulator [Rhodospirillaceae bacterium]